MVSLGDTPRRPAEREATRSPTSVPQVAWRALLASGAASRRDAAEGDLSGSLQNRNIALQKLGNGLFTLVAPKRTRRYLPQL